MTSLADLRALNIDQQREKATPDTGSRIPVDTGTRKTVSPSARTPVSTEASADGSTPGRKQVRKRARTGGSTEARTEASTSASERGGAEVSTETLVQAVLANLEKRRTHAGDVKSTVDMPRELSQRAKRYSLDHGNVAVRLVVIELLDAFLTAEKY